MLSAFGSSKRCKDCYSEVPGYFFEVLAACPGWEAMCDQHAADHQGMTSEAHFKELNNTIHIRYNLSPNLKRIFSNFDLCVRIGL